VDIEQAFEFAGIGSLLRGGNDYLGSTVTEEAIRESKYQKKLW